MLLSNEAEVIWNARNKKHYVELGYHFTRMGDSLLVNTKDLTTGSCAVVKVKCDYCGREKTMTWNEYNYIKKRSVVDKDACSDCLNIKSNESVQAKYGNYSDMFFASNDKRKATNIEKYGAENPFAGDSVKKKIADINLERYGVPYTQQCKEVRDKTRATCLEKYGVENYVELLKGKYIKENSPVWKGGVEYSRVERSSYEYIQWRKAVFERDRYECQCCHCKNGNGKEVMLNAHHIKNWRDSPDIRYDISNGITLCEKCHNEFHSIYGKRNNDYNQLENFVLMLDKKIC